MKVVYDEAKRLRTLAERGLDFADVPQLFAGPHFTRLRRGLHAEPRSQTFGLLDGMIVSVVWTMRGESRRVISLRKAHVSERTIFAEFLD